MSDKNCNAGSEAPKCPPKTKVIEKPFILTCTVPETATFNCPASECAPPPKQECICPPKEEVKVDECAPPPPKEDDCAPPPPKEDDCAPPPLVVEAAPVVDECAAPEAASTNSACGGPDNSCEAKPLFMTREDGSSHCGKNC